jgi:hypothetical protein
MAKCIYIMLAALAAGCTSGLPEDVARLGYVNHLHRFAMNVPAGWKVRESGGLADVYLLAPEGGSAVRANVNVVVEPGRVALTLEELTRSARAQVEALKGFRLVSEGPRSLAGGRKAFAVTFQQSAVDPKRPLQQRQLYVLGDRWSYIVTATAEADDFAAREADFEAVLQSFRAGW